MQVEGICHTYNHHQFFGNVRPYKKSNLIKIGFIEDLVLMIAKGNTPLFVVESPWLRQMVLCLCGQVKFPFQKQFVHEHIPILLLKNGNLCTPYHCSICNCDNNI
jgi:hypothetical protein